MVRLENVVFKFVLRIALLHCFRNLHFNAFNVSNKNKRKLARQWCACVVQRSFCSTSNAFWMVSMSRFQKCSKTIRKCYVCGLWNQLGARWCPLAAFVLCLMLFQQFPDLDVKSAPNPLETDTFGKPVRPMQKVSDPNWAIPGRLVSNVNKTIRKCNKTYLSISKVF